MKDPFFHQMAFVCLFLTTLFRALYMMEASLRPLLRKRYGNEADKGQPVKDTARNIISRDQAIMQEMWWVVVAGFLTACAGIAMWNLDNLYCNDFRRWRNLIGLPWGMVLEGHGVRISPLYLASH